MAQHVPEDDFAGREVTATGIVSIEADDEYVFGEGADIEMVEMASQKSSSTMCDEDIKFYAPVTVPQAPAIVTWRNLTVSVTKKGKTQTLLHNICGCINGGFWAIMGSSGGGKTTLLNALSLRLNKNINITGELMINGKLYNKGFLKDMSAYVMQDDVLMAELTVQETMEFTSKLRMDKHATEEERHKRIDELLELLGIAHVKDVKVGNSVKKGISGGERKRLCIAMELLSRPSLLFLDEPTSGLDSFTSLTVCSALKNLTARGECTVVCTIHQPQQQIFDLFDNLIFMKKGHINYQGSASKAMYFLRSTLKQDFPENVNVADCLLDMLARESTLDKGSSTRLSNMRETFSRIPVDMSAGSDKKSFAHMEEHSWPSQFGVLLGRNMRQAGRRWDLIAMTIIMSSIMALFVSAGTWLNLGDKKGQDFVGFWPSSIFFCFLTQGIAASFQAIHQFPLERALAMRERSAGTYRVSAYFLARSISDLCVQLLGPIVFCIIVYPMIGYEAKADKFFVMMFTLMLDCACATGLATMISCYCVNLNLTTVVLSMAMEICRVYDGFFIPPILMQDIAAWRWADMLSYLKYCFLAGVIYQLRGLEFECTDQEIRDDKCNVTRGEQVMEARGYDRYTVEGCVAAAFGFMIGYRVIAYLGLKYIKD